MVTPHPSYKSTPRIISFTEITRLKRRANTEFINPSLPPVNRLASTHRVTVPKSVASVIFSKAQHLTRKYSLNGLKTATRLEHRKKPLPQTFSIRMLKGGTLIRPLVKQTRSLASSKRASPTPKSSDNMRWYRDASESFVLGIEDRMSQLYRESLKVQELLKRDMQPKYLQELHRLEVNICNETKRYLNSAL